MTPLPVSIIAVVATLSFALHSAHSADLKPLLGTKDALLEEQKFDGDALPKGWNKNTGKISVADGVLKASQVEADKHIGAFRHPLPMQDTVIEVDFLFSGARVFNLGFDPAPGELKKTGHLFSIQVSPAEWSIREHRDKADANSKDKTHASAKISLEKGKWYHLMLEVKGNDALVQIDGTAEPLKATAPDFHVKKPGLVFRVGGKDADEMHFDNVKVWELK